MLKTTVFKIRVKHLWMHHYMHPFAYTCIWWLYWLWKNSVFTFFQFSSIFPVSSSFFHFFSTGKEKIGFFRKKPNPGCQPRQFYVSILTSDWRKFRRVEPKPVNMTSQTHKYLIFEHYINERPFWKKNKRGTSGEYACLHVQRYSATILQNPFRKSTYKWTCQYKWALPVQSP